LLSDTPPLLADTPHLLADTPPLLADTPPLLADTPPTSGLGVVLVTMRARLVAAMLLISDFFSMLIISISSTESFFDLEALTGGKLFHPALSAHH
jgi:hypothetical protein